MPGCRRAGGCVGRAGSGRWRARSGPERGHATLAAFAAPHCHQSAVRSTSATDRPVTSPARIPVSAINRTIASSRRSRNSLPPHALISRFSSSSVSESSDLRIELRGFQPQQRIVVDLTFFGQPRREPAHRRADGSAPSTVRRRRRADRPRTPSSARGPARGSAPCSSHHRMNPRTPSP